MAPNRSHLATKLNRFIELDDQEKSLLAGLEVPSRTIHAGQSLFDEGSPPPACFVIVSGWAAAYKMLEDGRRQIIAFALPGDFLGVRSLLLRISDHSVVAVTDLAVSEFPTRHFMDLIRDGPRLAAAIMWAVSREEAIVVEHLVSIGRRNALERTAHFFLELGQRLEAVGMSSRDRFPCPVIQEDLADALGLTAVHLNRTLRHLREGGLLTFSHRQVVVHDYQALIELAQFSNTYLDHDSPPVGGGSAGIAD